VGGQQPNPGALLAANFAQFMAQRASRSEGLYAEVRQSTAIQAFLPQSGRPGVLTGTNPAKFSANVFEGQGLALELGVDLSKAGVSGTGLAFLHVQSGPLKGYITGRRSSL
jgi:hypothetical protein